MIKETEAVILSASRTPIGKFWGASQSKARAFFIVSALMLNNCVRMQANRAFYLHHL